MVELSSSSCLVLSTNLSALEIVLLRGTGPVKSRSGTCGAAIGYSRHTVVLLGADEQ